MYRTHRVEVDDEVFQFVKGRAEPLVDDFNSALRRLLPLKGPLQGNPNSGQAASSVVRTGGLPELPKRTPEALRHILEVTYLVRSGSYPRRDATREIARWHYVAYQTVCDKYTRQLGLKAHEFDRLLEEDDLAGLRKMLEEKFAEHCDLIDKTLRQGFS
jgi:hypothetical protein